MDWQCFWFCSQTPACTSSVLYQVMATMPVCKQYLRLYSTQAACNSLPCGRHDLVRGDLVLNSAHPRVEQNLWASDRCH